MESRRRIDIKHQQAINFGGHALFVRSVCVLMCVEYNITSVHVHIGMKVK